MKMLNVLIIAPILVAYIDAIPNRRYPGSCRDVSGCPCGSQCVSRFGSIPCGKGGYARFCACRKGCVVGNIFIPAGTTNPRTYCNRCSCPSDPSRSKGIPACTRRAWCGIPRPIYPSNPNCHD